MLHLTVAEQIEPLAARLADVLREPPDDPFEPEWIAVPSDGMRRWLLLELARHLGASAPGAGDGVAANIVRAFPGLLRLHLLEADLPDGSTDPWRADHLAWAILEVLAGCGGDPLLGRIAEVPEGGSAYGRSRRIAQLFDHYHLHRPDMVRLWARGRDVDAGGEPIAAHHAWQPDLWRRVGAHLGLPSPPERLPSLLERLRGGTLDVDLPGRLVLFGLTNLPGGESFVEVLSAAAATREVHAFLLEPSTAAGRRLRSNLPPRPAHGRRLRSDDPTDGLVHHPLGRSWGRLHAETSALLADVAAELGVPEVLDAPPAAAGSLLGRFQAALRDDVAQPGDHRPDPADRSVQFHACHGATRQVEVLRDAVLHLLAADPTLTEDDIVVVCPALDRMAPTIEAVLGASTDRSLRGDDGPSGEPTAPRLRYRIADRSVRSVNPFLAAVSSLLELMAGRFEAPAVLDFLALPGVRHRFDLDDDQLSAVAEWVDETNVRWGIDPAHRETFGVPGAVVENSWRSGVDRLLIGAAVADEGTVGLGDLAPYGIEGADQVTTAGILAEVMWRLAALADEVDRPRPIAEWVALLVDACDDLFDVPRDDEWQREAFQRVTADLLAASRHDSVDSPVPATFADVRVAVRDQLAGSPGRPDFFRGGMTFSSTAPFRWVPHRVVCLLGMDQASLGAGAADGDDLTAGAPLLGDRDARSELRQALLEVVLAAREHLIVVRDGHDVKTNQPIPRSVVVAELRDALVATVHPDERAEFDHRLEIDHPRQPFDSRCFRPGSVAAALPQVWSFDEGAWKGARARADRTDTVAPFLDRALEADVETTIELAELREVVCNPIKAFVERRLGARIPRVDDPARSVLPVAPSGLDIWSIGDRLLDHLLEGGDIADWERVERRLGVLPPGVLGDREVQATGDEVSAMVEAARARGVRFGPAARVTVDARLPDGTRIVGTVEDRICPPEGGPVRIEFSRPKVTHELTSWIDLMALAVTDPTRSWRALSIHRGSEKRKPPTIRDVVPAGDPQVSIDERHRRAVAALEVAVDLYRRAFTEPLPLFRHLSPELVGGNGRPSDWTGAFGMNFGGDLTDPEVALTYGGYDFDALMAIPRRPGDPDGPTSRVRTYAGYLWGTLLSSVLPRDEDEP